MSVLEKLKSFFKPTLPHMELLKPWDMKNARVKGRLYQGAQTLVEETESALGEQLPFNAFVNLLLSSYDRWSREEDIKTVTNQIMNGQRDVYGLNFTKVRERKSYLSKHPDAVQNAVITQPEFAITAVDNLIANLNRVVDYISANGTNPDFDRFYHEAFLPLVEERIEDAKANRITMTEYRKGLNSTSLQNYRHLTAAPESPVAVYNELEEYANFTPTVAISTTEDFVNTERQYDKEMNDLLDNAYEQCAYWNENRTKLVDSFKSIETSYGTILDDNVRLDNLKAEHEKVQDKIVVLHADADVKDFTEGRWLDLDQDGYQEFKGENSELYNTRLQTMLADILTLANKRTMTKDLSKDEARKLEVYEVVDGIKINMPSLMGEKGLNYKIFTDEKGKSKLFMTPAQYDIIKTYYSVLAENIRNHTLNTKELSAYKLDNTIKAITVDEANFDDLSIKAKCELYKFMVAFRSASYGLLQRTKATTKSLTQADVDTFYIDDFLIKNYISKNLNTVKKVIELHGYVNSRTLIERATEKYNKEVEDNEENIENQTVVYMDASDKMNNVAVYMQHTIEPRIESVAAERYSAFANDDKNCKAVFEDIIDFTMPEFIDDGPDPEGRTYFASSIDDCKQVDLGILKSSIGFSKNHAKFTLDNTAWVADESKHSKDMSRLVEEIRMYDSLDEVASRNIYKFIELATILNNGLYPEKAEEQE